MDGGGDHTGSTYARNDISSAPDLRAVGILVGYHPWNADFWLPSAGRVVDNRVRGAVVNLSIDGIMGG